MCWQAARREDARVARRVYRKHVVDGVYRLDEGALLDDCCPCVRKLGVVDRREGVQGQARPREMVPVGHDRWREGLKPRCGIERMQALLAWRFSAEARLPWGGFKAQQVRQGVCQRGAATRQPPRPAGPMGPETLAHHLVPRQRWDLAAWFNGTMRALAPAGVVGAQVTGMVEATDLETTAAYEGGGQVTRPRQITEKPGPGRASAVTVYGGQPRVWIAALTQMPLAGTVVPLHAPAGRSMRALVPQARAHRAGPTRRHQVVGARGCWEGAERWGLDHHGLTVVVPARDHLAVTVEARAPAAAGAGLTVGRRVHTMRHGQGNRARTARQETAVVGIAGLTPDDQDGTPAHGRHRHRRDVKANPIPAVGVRQWPGRDDGPGGNTVFRPHASVQQPWPPFDAADDRRRIEPGGSTEAKPPGDLGHPPQNTARAVPVQVLCTCVLGALATAYRLPCAHAPRRAEPVGWQRWRRQLLAQTRDQIIVWAPRGYGLVPLAACALLVGGQRKDVPPGIGARQDVLATYRLTGHE